MDSDKNEVDKLVEHLIRQELEGLRRNAKEQEGIATTQEAGQKQDEANSGQSHD